MSLSFNTIPDKRLAASILGTDMSFRVSNILGWDGEDLVAGDFGTLHYVAFRNSANTALELMEIDPSTIASGSITINKRGLDFNGDLTTQVTANKLLWVKGDTIVSFGTNPPQLYQYLKEYIDGIAIAGSPDASTTAKGLMEEATLAELRARTAAGSTAARLAVNPSTLPNVLIADYIADTGTADAYLIAPSPAIVAYVTGQVFTFKATNANTTTSTVNVNSLGVKTIKKYNGATDLDAGDISSGQIVMVQYDGTNFQLLNPTKTNYVPTGAIMPFAGASAPNGWLLADGTAVSRTTYAALFTAISTTYGAGNGTTTFNVPDLSGRVAVGKSADTEFDTLGETGGEKTHTLITAEMPSHTHTLNGNSATNSTGFVRFGDTDNSTVVATTNSTGGDGAHNNLQPYITLNYIIKT